MESNLKNVFVLNTGRCGSTTFSKACQYMTNYTSGHELRVNEIGDSRLNYPTSHIEVDHNFCWMLGNLDQLYGNKAFYVHLVRDKQKVIKSTYKRWNYSFNSTRFFTQEVLGIVPELLSESEKLAVVSQENETKTSAINLFLLDKTNTILIDIDDPKKAFTEFWNRIGAEGNLEKALLEFDVRHNENITSAEAAFAEQAFKREIRAKIFRKRISEAPSSVQKLKLRCELVLFKLTGLHSDLF